MMLKVIVPATVFDDNKGADAPFTMEANEGMTATWLIMTVGRKKLSVRWDDMHRAIKLFKNI